MAIIKYHTDLKVYQKSFEVAMEIYKISFQFPSEEKYWYMAAFFRQVKIGVLTLTLEKKQ